MVAKSPSTIMWECILLPLMVAVQFVIGPRISGDRPGDLRIYPRLQSLNINPQTRYSINSCIKSIPSASGLNAPSLPLVQSPIYTWFGLFLGLAAWLQLGVFLPLIFYAFMHPHIYPPKSIRLQFGVHLIDRKEKFQITAFL